MTKKTAVYIACIVSLYAIQIPSRSNAATITTVKTTEQSSTLRAGTRLVTVVIPPAADVAGARLSLHLRAGTPGPNGDTGLRVAIIANQAVTLITSPSFRIKGIGQTSVRSYFMQLVGPEIHGKARTFLDLLRSRIVTEPGSAEATVTLSGLRMPMALAKDAEYRFSLIASGLPIFKSPPPGQNPTQTLYVANALSGTITTYSLPLAPGTYTPNPLPSTINTNLILSHGLIVYDQNNLSLSGFPSNQIFVNATNCTLSFTCSWSLSPSVLVYPKGGGTATQYQLSWGPINYGPTSAGPLSICTNAPGNVPPVVVTVNGVSDYICYGPVTVNAYNGLSQTADQIGGILGTQLIGADVIDQNPAANGALTGYVVLGYVVSPGSLVPMFLPREDMVQDITGLVLTVDAEYLFYALVGSSTAQPPSPCTGASTCLGLWAATNLAIQYFAVYSPAVPIMATDVVPQFQDPTSAYASSTSWGPNINTPLFVTDSGTFVGGQDSVFIFQRPLGSNPTPCAISGSATQLSEPQAAVTDALGNLYVANGGNNSITVYQAPAPGTSGTLSCGNLAPITTLYGGNVLNLPISLAIGAAN